MCISLVCGSGFSVVATEPSPYTLSQEGCAEQLGLSEEELQQLKTAIFAAAVNFEEECDISSFAIPYNSDTESIMGEIVFKGHPEVFHIEKLSFSYRVGADPIFTRVNFVRYKYDQPTYLARLKECRDAAAVLLEGIADSTLSDVEKALLLHDRLAVWCEYDSENLRLNTVPEEDYTMYGALAKGVAVCEGYVQAYCYLLGQVGIESYMCASYAMGHAWNIVEIDGKRYHVDVTWDDPTEDITGRVTHDNFLRSSDGAYETGHEANDYDTSPTDTAYDNAFWQSSQAAFQLLDGKIYYIDSENEALKQWKGNDSEELCSVKDTWRAGAASRWPGSYARLGSDEDYLYYTLSKAVYRYDPATGETAAVYQPTMPEGYFAIYGFEAKDDYFYCDIYNSPNFTLDTKDEYQVKYPYRTTQLQSVEVTRLPAKTTYLLGESLDTAGLQLTLTYTSNVTETVEDGFTVSGYDATAEGKQTITVTYQELTDTFEVFVQKPPVDDDDDGDDNDDDDGDDNDDDDGDDNDDNDGDDNDDDDGDDNDDNDGDDNDDDDDDDDGDDDGDDNDDDGDDDGDDNDDDDDDDNGDDNGDGQEPVAKGDVDGDNAITSTDARLTLQVYAGKIQSDVINVLAADVDSDGTITSTDARLILQYYAGKITAWP